MTGEDRQAFLYAFFPFLFGVYPYTTATEKQKQAMDLAHIHYPRYSIYTITKSLVAKLLQPFQLIPLTPDLAGYPGVLGMGWRWPSQAMERSLIAMEPNTMKPLSSQGPKRSP